MLSGLTALTLRPVGGRPSVVKLIRSPYLTVLDTFVGRYNHDPTESIDENENLIHLPDDRLLLLRSQAKTYLEQLTLPRRSIIWYLWGYNTDEDGDYEHDGTSSDISVSDDSI